MRAKRRNLILLTALGLCLGCESWYASTQESVASKPISHAIQRLRMQPDSVVLEIAVANMDQSDLPQFDELWRKTDASGIDLHDRQVLDQNGIRVGLLSSHVPAELHQLMAPKPIDENGLDPWQEQLMEKGLLKPISRFLLHDGIQNRRGEMHPVPVSQIHEQASWIIHVGDRKLAGTGNDVRAVIEVKTYPKGDGTVRLICTPALHIGRPRTQIGVRQQSFAYETAQSKKLLNDLRFEVCLRSGESVIVAPTSDLGDLGGLFFGAGQAAGIVAQDSEEPTFRVLMLRLLQTQMDDLFDTDSQRESLTTTFVE